MLAGVLGFLLGPVGLWYKGQWAAGLVWLGAIAAAVFLLGILALPVIPFLWIGMAIHAAFARAR
ncbi:MAG: hypothetical protein HY699_12990 [Deltaproteobacteria bacterium]|nr:hypothetical protein [Deltaproteobacteria bacterium]